MSDYRITTGEPIPEGRRQRCRQRRLSVKRAVWGGTIVLLAGFIIPVHIRVAANGYVTTDLYAEVRPAVAGQVAEIRAQSGLRVRTGDLLVRLDDAAAKAALDEALGAVSQVEARLVRREAELAQEKRQRNHLLAEARLRRNHAETSLKMTDVKLSKGSHCRVRYNFGIYKYRSLSQGGHIRTSTFLGLVKK